MCATLVNIGVQLVLYFVHDLIFYDYYDAAPKFIAIFMI